MKEERVLLYLTNVIKPNCTKCIPLSFSVATKLLLEHSDSNSSTDSAASSVGSGGSDGNSNEYHPPVQQKPFLPENGHSRFGAKALVPQFGLSPPSESKLLQRRNRFSVERKQPRSAKAGIDEYV